MSFLNSFKNALKHYKLKDSPSSTVFTSRKIDVFENNSEMRFFKAFSLSQKSQNRGRGTEEEEKEGNICMKER